MVPGKVPGLYICNTLPVLESKKLNFRVTDKPNKSDIHKRYVFTFTNSSVGDRSFPEFPSDINVASPRNVTE